MEQMVVTIAEAVKLTRISQAKLYQLFNDGTVETIHIGRRRFVKVASLKKLLQIEDDA